MLFTIVSCQVPENIRAVHAQFFPWTYALLLLKFFNSHYLIQITIYLGEIAKLLCFDSFKLWNLRCLSSSFTKKVICFVITIVGIFKADKNVLKGKFCKNYKNLKKMLHKCSFFLPSFRNLYKDKTPIPQ